jgi:lipopolysaccharide transport system permease protein
MLFEIRPPSRFSLGLTDLWDYRELFYFFAWRDVKLKYRQTALGVAWAVLQPLLLMGAFTLFFGGRLRAETDLPYPVFAFTGLLLWGVFAAGLSGAGNSMVGNAHIIRKVYFPRLIIPVSSVLVALFDFLVALPVLAGLLAWYGLPPRPTAPLFFAAGLVLAAAATLGIGCWLGALSVKYRDFRYVLPFLLQLLLFVTPVIYPVSYLKAEWMRLLLAVNPMSGAMALFRAMVSEVPLDWRLTALSALSALALLAQGFWYFRRTEAYFADLA